MTTTTTFIALVLATAVVLKQQGHWTYGALANHLWSFAGDSGRDDVNAT